MLNATKTYLQSYFEGSLQYRVPFFQRAYVWDDDDWKSFWENVNAVYCDYSKGKTTEHFIGTIITKQAPADYIGQQYYDLIDGQQRLTTIAILLKSMADSCADEKSPLNENLNRLLTFRDDNGKQFFRIEPCRNDQPYFRAVVNSDPFDNLKNQENNILAAYNYFKGKVSGFTDDDIKNLKSVILKQVPVISMLLSADDDEQVIFDTINSLGVKLTTAELLKNYIFKGKELERRFDIDWVPAFEADEDVVRFWNKEKTAGRITRTNIEVLLYSYLIIETLKEVKLESLYKEYKEWLAGKTSAQKEDFLHSLKKYAEIYSSFPEGEELNDFDFSQSEKRFFHIIENLQITTIYPLILFVYQIVTDSAERARILRLLESFLVRRNICRLTTKNYNNLFIQMIKKLKTSQNEKVPVSAELFVSMFADFSEDTNKFPTDLEFEVGFKESQLSNQNAREILYCLALHQVSSPLNDVHKLSSGSYSAEHMMPVKWEVHWNVANLDALQKIRRNAALRTIGNLTLITGRLNSKLSNAAWVTKATTLKKYSILPMTTDYLTEPEWNEDTIATRADNLFKNSVLQTWPNYA